MKSVFKSSAIAAVALAAVCSASSAAVVVSFQQGVGGYTGTVDTQIYAGTPDVAFDQEIDVSTDLSDGGAVVQSLIRFDQIIGPGAAQIPAGSQVVSASLRFFTTSSTSGTIGYHRMLAGWPAAATWNSMVGGVTADNVEARTLPDASASSIIDDTPLTLDVTASVKAWVEQGDANNGWAMLNDSTDGWDFATAEWSAIADRPVLSVTYEPVPEPAALGVLAVLASLTARRRRH